MLITSGSRTVHKSPKALSLKKMKEFDNDEECVRGIDSRMTDLYYLVDVLL